MPRIDPVQLLKCLSVLLSPSGGIKSGEEVQRLANLMTKFSKKLVSKCIYIQILKCTESELLSLFMGSGGWQLVHVWLTESIVAKNWPLVRELLELLLLCPVDIERLKTNNCPKLVKELSKDGNHQAIRALASKLVEQWLKTVKGEFVVPLKSSEIREIVENVSSNDVDVKNEEEMKDAKIKAESQDKVKCNNFQDNYSRDDYKENKSIQIKQEDSETLPILKITVKDGKQVISQVDEVSGKSGEKKSDKDKPKHKSKDKHSESSSSKSSSSKHTSKSRSSEDKSRSNSSHKSSKNSSSKDKSRERDKSSHSSSKSSKHSDSSRRSSDKSSSNHKSSSSEKKDSDRDKSKDKNEKKESSNKSSESTETPSIQKLGKIPKLSDRKEKQSISIEVRKPDEPKPKTVKTFHSKFRKHGLEEEVKPPPSRASLLNKKSPIIPPTVSIPKRPSPIHNETPPEKKAKTIETVEKPGAIKLIPAKPKPMMLLESDMFMDALNASATNKKEPKKRKRRTSGSKDGPASDSSPPHTPVSPSSEKSVPPRFYQDTLEAVEEKDKSSESHSDTNENSENSTTKLADKKTEEEMEISEPHTHTVNGLKGVLCYHKRKGPKKSIKWKADSELEEIQYFELDETERVNVTKTFNDMKNQDRMNEREAFEKARNLSTDDIMEERTSWRSLIPIDCEGQSPVEYGKLSKEKEIQAVRQKGTLQSLYFHKAMIPDSPLEPDVETHTYSEPNTIPLEDITGNQDNVSDFRNMPWPEPKGNAPAASTSANLPNIFPGNIPQFPVAFPTPQFPGVPNFQGPNIGPPGEWPAGVPMMTNGMMPGAIPPGMMVPPENMMMAPEMFGASNQMFPQVPDAFNMMDMNMGQNMFPPDFNMGPGQMPAGPEGFAGPVPGPGNFRGAMRGRGVGGGGHWRGKGAGNWDGPQRGRGGGHNRGRGKAVCIYFQRKGSCRQGDNCSFLHPGVNCPF